MVNLMGKRDQFIAGLVQWEGWEQEWAEAHFMNSGSMYEIGNEVDLLLGETMRIRLRFPRILVMPLMMFRVEDNRLSHVRENVPEYEQGFEGGTVA